MNRVISAAWRLRRALTAESALFNSGARPATTDVSGSALAKIGLLSRYEVALERSLNKALVCLDHLRRMQQPHNPGDSLAQYPELRAFPGKNLDELAHSLPGAKEESQQKPGEFGFVSQK